MHEDWKKRLKQAIVACALLLVAAATWFVLDRLEHRPGWLVVETPAAAVVGRVLEIRVTLDPSIEPSQIVCSLFRLRADGKDWGYLASAGPSRPAVGGETYSFAFTVPDREDAAFTNVLVFLSPTGKWEDATRAVTTEFMPVERDGQGARNLVLRRTNVDRYLTAAEAERTGAGGQRQRPLGQPSGWVHPVLFVLLLTAAALCLAKAGRKAPGTSPHQDGERTVWLLFGALLILCAALELSGIAGHLVAWARRLAQERHLYESRKAFQKMIMAAVAAASLGFFLLFIRATRKPGSHRFLWWAGIGLAAYLAVSFVSVLSFHAVDVARSMTWHGVSPIDGLRGAGAVVTLVAALLAVRRKAGRAPI